MVQVIGLAGVTFQTGFWAVTDRIEPTLLLFFGGAVGIGQTLEAVTRSRDDAPTPAPPEVEPAPVARLPIPDDSAAPEEGTS